MYKVKFIDTCILYDLVGFNGDRIIIRFNNGQSIGTVNKTGYKLLNKNLSWEDAKNQIPKIK